MLSSREYPILGALCLALALLQVCSSLPTHEDTIIRNPHGGSWEGVVEDGIIAYYGIKYVFHPRRRPLGRV